MSVVILGGNECMIRQYKTLCEKYKCKAKIFAKMETNLRNKIGSPDLLVLFTGTMSHKMLRCALDEAIGSDTVIVRSHSGSMAALRTILDEHTV